MGLQKAKILFICKGLQRGGAESMMVSLANNLVDLYDVVILNLKKVNDYKISDKIELLNYDFEFRSFSSIKQFYYEMVWRTRRKFKKDYQGLIDLIDKINPQVIHLHLDPIDTVFIKFLTLEKRRITLFTDHTMRIREDLYPWYINRLLGIGYRNVYRQYTTIAISLPMYTMLSKYRISGKNKIEMIPNGIDVGSVSQKNNYSPEKNIFKFIYVARLDMRKGHTDLLKAWKHASFDFPAELHLIGGDSSDGEIVKEINEQIAKSKEKKIIWHGDVRNVNKILQSFDAAVFPSHVEGFSIALLEKMAAGLPIIVSDIPSFKSVVQDGENGIFFKKQDVSDLVQKMTLIANDLGLREKIGKGALKLVTEKYTLEKMTQSYRAVYEKLIKQGKPQVFSEQIIYRITD